LRKIYPDGKLLAIDLDPESLQLLKSKLKSQKPKIKNNILLVQGNFKNLKKIVKENNFEPINGILLDLGLSSWQRAVGGLVFSETNPWR